MATRNYTTKTAALKATLADIRKVGAKEVTSKSFYVEKADGSKTALQPGIEIEDANSETTLTYGEVPKVNFAGDYVNVVKNEDGSVTLYINENKSLKPVNTALSGTPSTSSYYQFTNDDYTVTGAATKNIHGTKTVGNASGYTAVTLTATTTSSNPTVSTGAASDTIFATNSSENSIWFRTTANGTVGSIASQKLDSDLTNKTTTQDGVTLTVTNLVLTKDHASLGKVPGQTETSAKFSFDPDTVVPNGGSIKLEWAISKAEPTTWNETNLFYAEHTATPTASAIIASITDEVLTDKVSGMQYVTSGSTLNIKVDSLENSQNKISKSLNRLQITDATNKTYTYAIKTDGTMTAGMTETSGDGAKAASAVYALDIDLTTGSSIAASSFTVSGKTWDYNDADNSPSISLTSATISRPYYGTVTASTDTVEYFSKENKRTNAGMVAWTQDDSNILFTGSENIIDGRVPAIVQMGKLYHPSNSSIIEDANGNKPTSSDTDAVFYRVVKLGTGTGDTPKLKLTGTNLNNSNIGIYLKAVKSDGSLEPKTWKINAEPSVTDAIGTGIAAAGGVSASQVLFDFNTTLGVRPRECDGFLLMIVMKKSTATLSTLTFAKQ